MLTHHYQNATISLKSDQTILLLFIKILTFHFVEAVPLFNINNLQTCIAPI